MSGKIADEIEMRLEARVGQHAPGVAAYWKDLAPLDEVMAVELEGFRLIGEAAFIDDRLAVILAGRLEVVELEQAIGGREELREPKLLFHRLIGDADRLAGHEARVEEPRLFGNWQEVVPVKRAAEAFAIEHRSALT